MLRTQVLALSNSPLCVGEEIALNRSQKVSGEWNDKWMGDHRCSTGGTFPLGGAHSVSTLVVVPLLSVGLMLFAVRYGLFALVVAMFVADQRDSPMTLDSSAFYFGTSCVAVATIIGVGA
jgi:hypothetical protein